jgi:hypothetical protein
MALSQMFTIGFPLAGRTWLAGVRQLQRGRQVRSFADGRTEIRMLLEPVDRQSWSLPESVRMLRHSLDETVGRICRRLDSPVGLGLSGGLDSRILLASLHTQKISHRSFTFCLAPEEPDNRVAKSAAELLGVQHETVVLKPPSDSAFYRAMRLINEGESPGFAFLLMALYARQETGALLIGNEAVRETAGSFQPISVKSKRGLANKMLAEYLKLLSPEQLRKLIAPHYRVSWNDLLDEWYDSFEQIEQPSIMDVFLDHVADYRVQRRTRGRLEQARWYCLPVYPFMDERVYSIYLRLPLRHLHAEQAPLALLCDYKTGLEKLPSAARHYSLPICQGYRFRHLIHLGHILQEKVLLPLQQQWQESKGRLGFGQSALSPEKTEGLYGLKRCDLFHWPAVEDIIQQAGRGTFVNRNALSSLINAGVINDFLFGSGFVSDRGVSILESPREIRFLRGSSPVSQIDSRPTQA